jgi:hypothetical protein
VFAAVWRDADSLKHARAAEKSGNKDPELQKMLEMQKKIV